MRIVWRIGLPATGGARAERMLEANRALIERRAVLVLPGDWALGPALGPLRQAGQAAIQDGDGGRIEAFRAGLAALRRRLEAAPQDRAILSDERLYRRRIRGDGPGALLDWTRQALAELRAAFEGHETLFVLHPADPGPWPAAAHDDEIRHGRCRAPWAPWRRSLGPLPDAAALERIGREAGLAEGALRIPGPEEARAEAGRPGLALLRAAGLEPALIERIDWPPPGPDRLPRGAREFLRRVNRTDLDDAAVAEVARLVDARPDLFAETPGGTGGDTKGDTGNGSGDRTGGARTAGPGRPGHSKVSSARLRDLPLLRLDEAGGTAAGGTAAVPMDRTVRLEEHAGGLRLDYLWVPRPGARRMVVLFSGAAPRDRFAEPPVFQRWSWAPAFDAHCLFVSDPALWRDPGLSLGWYLGTEDHDPMPDILRTIDRLAAGAGLGRDRIWAYGSSAGGYGALRLAALAAEDGGDGTASGPGSGPGIGAVALNPQTDLARYHGRGAVRRLCAACFGGRRIAAFRRDFPDRASLLGRAATLAGRRLVLVQNLRDPHHLEEHYRPLCAAMGMDWTEGRDGPVHRILWDGPGGHGAAESEAVFARCLAIMDGGTPAHAPPDRTPPDRTPPAGASDGAPRS